MRIILLSATLALAFGAGFVAARYTSNTSAPPSIATLNSPPPTPLRPVPANLNSPTPTPASAHDTGSGDSPTYPALRAAVLLASKQFPWMRIQPFGGERLDQNFAKLYELTPAEVAHLNAVFQRAKEQVDALEAERAEIEPQPDGTIRITIEPFPKEGGAFHDSVRAALLTTLGPIRSELYRQLSESDDSDATAFGGFGLRRTVIHIRPVGPDGKARASTFDTVNISTDAGSKVPTFSYQMDLRALKAVKPALHARLVGASTPR